MKRGFFDVLGGVSLALAIIFLWNVRFAAEFSVSWQQQPFFFPYFTILVAIVLAIGSHTLILKRILDNKLFRYTAKISFGLYLWHYLLISLVAMWAKDYHYMGVSSLTRWALMSASILAVSYIIATLSYYFVEKPVLDWAHKIKFKNKVSVEKLETREF